MILLCCLFKPKGRRLLLQSLSSLRVSLQQNHQNESSGLSVIPKFLQDEEGTEQNEKVVGFQVFIICF